MKRRNKSQGNKWLWASSFLGLFTSVFLLIVLFYYVGVTPQTIIEGGEIGYKANVSVERFVVMRGVADQLNDLYVDSGDREYANCLQARQEGNAVVVTGTRTVPVYFANESMVDFQILNCGVAFIHSHPSGYCLPSTNDLYVWGFTRNRFTVIQCGVDKFGFFTAEGNVGVPVGYEIV